MGLIKGKEDTLVHYNTQENSYLRVVDLLAEAYGLKAIHIDRSKSMFAAGGRAKRCRMVVIWNGCQGETGLMMKMCRRRGIPLLIYEMGLLPQDQTFLADTHGYCGDSMMNGDLAWLTSADYDRLYRVRAAMRERWPQKPSEHALIPLQIENDTQILYYTPFEDMNEFVRYVQEKFAGFPRRLFRCHPRSTYPGDRDFGPNDVLDHETDFNESLRAASVVIGLTSTALYEAAIYGVPVIALGDHPLAKHATRQDDVAAAVLALRIDRDGSGLVGIAERFNIRPLGHEPLEELPSTAQPSKMLGALCQSATPA